MLKLEAMVGCSAGGGDTGRGREVSLWREDAACKYGNDAVMVSDGRIVFTVESRHVVLAYDPLEDEVTLIAGQFDTPGDSLDHLSYPCGLVEFEGRILVADRENHRVMAFALDDMPGPTPFIWMGSTGVPCPPAEDSVRYAGDCDDKHTALLDRPCSLAVVYGSVFIACYTMAGGQVRKVDPDGKVSSVIRESLETEPQRLVAGDGGWLYLTRKNSASVTRIHASTGEVKSPWAMLGVGARVGGVGVSGSDLMVIRAPGASALGRVDTAANAPQVAPIIGAGSLLVGDDGADGKSPPFPYGDDPAARLPVTSGEFPARVLADEQRTTWVVGKHHVYRYVHLPRAPDTYPSAMVCWGGHHEDRVASMLEKMLPGSSLSIGVGARPDASVAAFKGDGNVWLVNTAMSNPDVVGQFDDSPELGRGFARNMYGAFEVKTCAGRDGAFYLRIVNRAGVHVLSRWVKGSEVHEYGYVLVGKVGNEVLVIVAGMGEISTRAAAFVAARASTVPAYRNAFAGTNAVLVHVRHDVSLADAEKFRPGASVCRVMRMGDVQGSRPVPL